MASTQTTDLVQVADVFIKAFDAGDWQRFKAPLSPDVAYEETGTGRRTQGADVYVQLVQMSSDAPQRTTPTLSGKVRIHHAEFPRYRRRRHAATLVATTGLVGSNDRARRYLWFSHGRHICGGHGVVNEGHENGVCALQDWRSCHDALPRATAG